MRSIVCRFQSEEEFFSHLFENGNLTFLARCNMSVGEKITVTVMVSNPREQCRLEMRVVERTALVVDRADRSARRLWNYVVRPQEEDLVWLEAFKSKLQTISRVQFAA